MRGAVVSRLAPFGRLAEAQRVVQISAPPDNGNDGASLSLQPQRWSIVAVKSGPAAPGDRLYHGSSGLR